ncbi:MAG TPA: MerR family transcriptional regulator [Bryobacterales bacterium]|nr:MerR family transcriptional regulator [Bryobacterales bacterium]
MAGLTIGKVAEAAGVNIDTLRYYERRGLIPKPARTHSNYRVYSPETISRVRFVKRAQALGFSLEQIRGLLELRTAQGARCEDVRRRAEEKIRELDAKIQALERMKEALQSLVRACAGSGPVIDCPIIESLDSPTSEGTSWTKNDH